MSRSQRPREFFVDRSLGRHRVPEALRRAGWALRTHHEIYGERDEWVPDVEWLELCGRRNMPVLSKDRRLRACDGPVIYAVQASRIVRVLPP